MEFNLSIIICVKDSSSDLKFHLNEAENYNSRQIIFVCGTDEEYDYAKRYVENNKKTYVVKRDNSVGIGDARKVGMESAESEYTMYLGPDNRITKDKIQDIITDLKNSRFSALAFSQKIKNPRNYLQKLQNFRFKNKFPPYLPRDVIGTPHIILTSEAKEIGYVSEAGPCDDTLFFNEFTKKVGEVAFSKVSVYEEPQDIVARMKWYSQSDYEYLQYQEKKKIKNYFHSFTTEFLYIFNEKNFFTLLFFLPGAAFLGLVRYISFFRKLFSNP